tara:strand:+ start:365 stop:655 length:291 start_codon:yes stop_codon:yes gene_type:complete
MGACFDLLIHKKARQILAELQEKASHPIADMLASMPDVAGFRRMSGAVYYLLLVAVSDMKAYIWATESEFLIHRCHFVLGDENKKINHRITIAQEP